MSKIKQIETFQSKYKQLVSLLKMFRKFGYDAEKKEASDYVQLQRYKYFPINAKLFVGFFAVSEKVCNFVAENVITRFFMQRRILLIYTGGTIGMNRNPLTGALEPFDFEHLLQNVPELAQFDTQIDTYQFDPPIDSSDMTPALWTDLSHCIADHYWQYDGFVVLHGTDTMAYTASALSYMLENLTKPVVFTGSQLPIGQLRTDGKENLITSIEIAAACDDEGHALVPEVGIYFNSHLLRGNRTTKQSAEEFNAFESFNYPHLVDAGVNITYHQERILKPDFSKSMTPYFRLDNNVIIFSLFPGIREDLIRHIIHTPNLKAIVMRTFGSGNAPQSPWLLNALKEGTKNGKVIVNVSQCLQGAVEMSRYDCGYHLQEAGVISGRDMTVESAVTKLMFLQSHYPDAPDTVRHLMQQSICGEMTI
jgi:L-asparaginase